MKETDRAYAAGVIDGEGSIGCGISNRGIPQLFVAVGMTDPGVVSWLHKNFGGGFYIVKNLSATHKQNYQWQVNGKSCQKVLDAIWPYSKLKRENVRLALAFLATIRPEGMNKKLSAKEFVLKHKLSDELRKLNKKGVR